MMAKRYIGSALSFLVLLSGMQSVHAQSNALSSPLVSTTADANEWGPSWSPDGTRLAFSSQRSGNFEVYVLHIADQRIEQLTQHEGADFRPKWSPDGTRIAFASDRDGDFELYTMTPDGGNIEHLTDHPANEQRMAWSPNGQQIVFESDRDGDAELYVMSLASGASQRLTTSPGFDGYPDWSPDGQRIVFNSGRNNPDGGGAAYELFVVNADGTGLEQLTENTGNDQAAAWSPDGEQVAYFSTRDGNAEIYVMDVARRQETRLTVNNEWDFMPAWSPDGTQLAFDSRRDGRRGIYTMQADGTNAIQHTNKTRSPFIELAAVEGLDKALAQLQTAHDLHPSEDYYLQSEVRALARDYMAQGNAVNALRLLERNTEIYPAAHETFVALGDLLQQLKLKRLAVDAYVKALTLAPDNVTTIAQLQQARID